MAKRVVYLLWYYYSDAPFSEARVWNVYSSYNKAVTATDALREEWPGYDYSIVAREVL